MKQPGLFDPDQPAPDPVAKEINDLRKLIADRLLEYSESSGERRRELDLGIRAARERLRHVLAVRRRQEALRAACAPPPPPPRRGRPVLRALPKPYDGKRLATGEKDDE